MLYTPDGHRRPSVPRLWLEERHDLCEDLAQLLAEKAKEKVWQLGITASDALERIAMGLSELSLDLSEAEQAWVLARTQEVLNP